MKAYVEISEQCGKTNRRKVIGSGVFKRALAVFCLAALAMSSLSSFAFAESQTVACTGTETININTQVNYVHATKTCTISDVFSLVHNDGNTVFDISVTPGIPEKFFFIIGSNFASTNFTSCAMGNYSGVNGSTCRSDRTTDGTETASLSFVAASGETITMNVAYTIAGGGFSMDVTSASVTITTISPKAFQNLQSSISRAQSGVVVKGVGARIALASSVERGGQKASSASFAAALTIGESNKTGGRTASRGASIRELAMLASFDTSRMVLAAAGDAQDPLRGIEQRRGLPANRPYTVWGHGSFTSLDNDRNRTGSDSRYGGDVWGYNIGVDYRFRPGLLAGVSVGFSDTDLTTTFNSGAYDETNWTISPYAMYQPMDGVTLSAIAGYSIGDVDRTRDSTVTGNTDNDTWFASFNGEYKLQPSETTPLDLSARLALLISRKYIDSFTESDGTVVTNSTTDTLQLKPGLEAAYRIVNNATTFQPFVKVDYVHDFTDEINNDNGAINLGGGLRIISGATGFSGSVEGEGIVGRDDYREHSFSGLIAYSFGVSSGGGGGSRLGIASPYVKSNFNSDGGQAFGAGFKFASDGGAFNGEIGLSQSFTAARTTETAGRISAQLKF